MISNRQRKVRVTTRPLEAFLQRVEKELGVGNTSVTVCLVSDTEIAQMNEQFRKKKGPTDVLSFPQDNSFSPLATRHSPLVSPGQEGKQRSRGRERTGTRHASENVSPLATRHSPPYLGDIAIAPETARRYAKKNGRSLESELRVLILHGVLHLLGYDHETDHGEMDRFEQKLRRRFELA